MRVNDNVVWITGASSGIGEAVAYELAQLGAKLILSARRTEELLRVKNACVNPDNVAILPFDLTNSDELAAKARQAFAFFGTVDILFNNGGISQRSLALETSAAVYQRLMQVNFFSYIELSKQFHLQRLKNNDNSESMIIVTSSVMGKIGTAYRSGYAASKHALHGYFDSLRAELPQKDKIMLLCPGFIKTNVSYHSLTKDGQAYNALGDKHVNCLAADILAKKLVKAIAKNKQEVYIGGKEIIGVYLKRFLPRLYATVIRKIKVT